MAFIRSTSGGGNYNCGTSILKSVSWNQKLGDFTTTKKAIGFILSTINGGYGRSWTFTCFGTNVHLSYDANGTMNNKDMVLNIVYSDNAVTLDYLATDLDSSLSNVGGAYRWSFTPLYDS